MINESLRSSSLDIIGDLVWGTHFCLFYQTKGDLVDILVPYFKAGLENSEFCIWIVSQPLEVGEAKGALKQAVPDLDTYLGKGQIEIISCTDWNLEEGTFDPEQGLSCCIRKFKHALDSNYNGIRISQDMSWLKEKDWNLSIEYEKQMDDLINNYPIIALCLYSLDRCSATEIIDLSVNHQFALTKRGGEWERIENFRKKKEARIAFQSTKAWEETFDAVSDSIAIIDNDYRIIRANQEMAAKLGVAQEKCTGLTCYSTLHGMNEPPPFCPYKQLVGSELECVAEIQEDIMGRIFSVRISPLYNAEKKLTSCVYIAHNINNSNQIEESLRESEGRFRSVLENSLDSAYRMDLQSNYFDYMSPVIEQITGFSPLEIKALTSDDLLGRIHPEDRPQVIEGIARSLDEGFGTHEYRFKCKDGKYRWLADHFSIIKDKTDTIRFRAGVVRDITKSKKAEEALRLSNLYNRSLIEASMDPLVTIEADGKIKDVNNATELVTGHSREELIGTDFSDYFTEPEQARVGYQQVFMHGEVRNYPLEIQHKNGSITPVLYNASVYKDETGKVIGIFAAARDITQSKKAEESLRESEAKYRQIVETAQEGIWLIDRNDRTILVNQKLSEMLGYSIDEILGKSPRKFMAPEFCLNADNRLHEHMQGICHVLDYRFIRKDGTDLWCILSSSPLFDSQGKYAGSLAMILDITERRQVEEALRQSEARYRMLYENLRDAFVQASMDGLIIEFNDLYCQILGYSPEEMRAMTYQELTPERWRTFEDHIVREQIISRGYSDVYEKEYQRKDGTLVPVELRTILERDESGRPKSMWAIVRDITERKETEKALKKLCDTLEEKVKERTAELQEAYKSLKESEAGLAEAQKMAHIGNWDWDLITEKVYWSDELYRIYGRNPEEGAPSYKELLNYVHPEDREYVDKSIKKGLKEEPKNSIDYRIILSNGEERKVRAKAEVIFDEQNTPVRVKGITQDITELKKAEEKIQVLIDAVESSNDAIGTLSLEGIVMSWNKGAKQIYGYSAEDIIGRNISIAEPDFLKGEVKRFSEKIKQGEKSCHYETLRVKKDGTIINISATLSPVFNSSQKLVAILAIARDISERVKAEKELAEINKIRIKEIHHRIKNNLQVISSLLDLEAERFQNKEVLEAFKESQNRVISMALIHEELYKGGAESINFSAYLQKLAENLFRTYRLSSRNVRLYMNVERNTFFDLDVAVPLGIIVNELISNSLKHAFNEGEEGEIRIKLSKKEKGTRVHEFAFDLTISDNGKGIPEDIKFKSTESLGLKLVKILVEQLDGKIELKKTQGTEFRISFNVVGS